MTGILLAPEYPVESALLERFAQDFLLPDYSGIYSCATVNMLYAALLLLREIRQRNGTFPKQKHL